MILSKNPMRTSREVLEALLAETLARRQRPVAARMLQSCPDLRLGDYPTHVALVSGKILGISPAIRDKTRRLFATRSSAPAVTWGRT